MAKAIDIAGSTQMYNPHTQSPDDPTPIVSIVVPILNEAQDIASLLGTILALDPPQSGFEVLVVDGGSNDGTQKIVEALAAKWCNLCLYDNAKRLSSAGRNVGSRYSRGQYIVYIDGHCQIPRSDYLLRLVDIFRSTGADCLCRPQSLTDMADGGWACAIAKARHSAFGHYPGSDIYDNAPGWTNPRSAGAAYRKQCYEAVGGFDESFDACEDVEFNHRVAASGFSAYRHPDLAVRYRVRSTLPRLFVQMRRYGRGRTRLAIKHPSATFWLLPGILISIPVLALLLYRSTAPFLPTVVGFTSMYVLALLAAALISSNSWREPLRIALALVVVHVGGVVGLCEGMLESLLRWVRDRRSRDSPREQHTS